MDKYEFKIVANINGVQEILLQAFLFADSYEIASNMGRNVMENYQNNSNYTAYRRNIIIQSQLNLIE